MFLFSEKLVQFGRDPFGKAPVVDKNKCGGVFVDGVDQSRKNQRPNAVGGQVGKIPGNACHLQVHFLFVSCVDNCNVARNQFPAAPFLPAEESCNRLQRPLRCGEADAHKSMRRGFFEPLERKR